MTWRPAPAWTVAAQWCLAAAVTAAVALPGHQQPVDIPLGTLRDLPPAAANPAAVALAAAAHGCVTQDTWTATHGTMLPARLLMTRGTRVAVVTVPAGWDLARQGWTTTGWCTR